MKGSDIYKKKSLWKIYLGIAGIVILLLSTIYSNYLADRLAEGERDKVKIFVNTMVTLQKAERTDLDRDITRELENLNLLLQDIPVILVDEKGEITEYSNIRDTTDPIGALEKMKASGLPPIEGEGYLYKTYYAYSRTLTLLTYFPFVQISLLLAFFLVAYVGFSSTRRAEQNQVWVGMAKETAHQLGTPISAIIGWIEHLKISLESNEENQMIIQELEKDTRRLNLIADRFSKIGAEPELTPHNIYEILLERKDYISKRASRGVAFSFPFENKDPLMVNVNLHLFEWVFENLLRNALDAMHGEGEIKAAVYVDDKYVHIDMTDSGQGIPTGKFKTVFQPGYSTKKRGWGLGLSLAKRIIESYHGGKIFVKTSSEESGTTFTISLPKVV